MQFLVRFFAILQRVIRIIKNVYFANDGVTQAMTSCSIYN